MGSGTSAQYTSRRSTVSNPNTAHGVMHTRIVRSPDNPNQQYLMRMQQHQKTTTFGVVHRWIDCQGYDHARDDWDQFTVTWEELQQILAGNKQILKDRLAQARATEVKNA